MRKGFAVTEDDKVVTGCLVDPVIVIIILILLGLAAFALAPDQSNEFGGMATCYKNWLGNYVCK